MSDQSDRLDKLDEILDRQAGLIERLVAANATQTDAVEKLTKLVLVQSVNLAQFYATTIGEMSNQTQAAIGRHAEASELRELWDTLGLERPGNGTETPDRAASVFGGGG